MAKPCKVLGVAGGDRGPVRAGKVCLTHSQGSEIREKRWCLRGPEWGVVSILPAKTTRSAAL